MTFIKHQKIDEALLFAQENEMNEYYCIMVDMTIPSGKNRLFVYDFKNKKVVIRGLCAHGSGGGSTASEPVFSNQINSLCTSLGKYKIGERAPSKWGIHVHYKLHGLENTNSNAYERIIVLHSYEVIPDHEIDPEGLIGVSRGCPVVADRTMIQIDNLLKSGEKNMLLWIYI